MMKKQKTTDLHTAKPLQRGLRYFTSGHVKDIQDSDDFYLLNCKVQSSYKHLINYNVTCIVAFKTGFIRDTSCECTASAMGRCSHVAGLLYAILDFKKNFESNTVTCTGEQMKWNMGRKKNKNPKALHEAQYDSFKRKSSNSSYNFDPRPPSLRQPPSQQKLKDYIKALQTKSTSFSGDLCMAASILKIV